MRSSVYSATEIPASSFAFVELVDLDHLDVAVRRLPDDRVHLLVAHAASFGSGLKLAVAQPPGAFGMPGAALTEQQRAAGRSVLDRDYLDAL